MSDIGEQIAAWGTVVGISIWGGAVRYYRQLRRGVRHAWWRLAGELITSGGAGLIVGALCLDAGMSPAAVTAWAGVAGYMGVAIYDFAATLLRSVLTGLAGAAGRDSGS